MSTGARLGSSRATGFTIVETMIVLAVTAALFVLIAATLSGRQNEAEFVQAIQQTQSQIQQVIDEAENGVYPSGGDFSCTSGATSLVISSGVNPQGTNQDCVFLGKVIQFDVQSGTSNEQYNVYTTAGLRCTAQMAAACAGSATMPFQNVYPTVVSVASTITPGYLSYGLTTTWMSIGYKQTSIGAVGFLMEPGTTDVGSQDGYTSGAQQVDLVPITNTQLNEKQGAGIIEINSNLGDSSVNPQAGVDLCFVSGSTNQSGLISIGTSGDELVATLTIESNTDCKNA